MYQLKGQHFEIVHQSLNPEVPRIALGSNTCLSPDKIARIVLTKDETLPLNEIDRIALLRDENLHTDKAARVVLRKNRIFTLNVDKVVQIAQVVLTKDRI